MASFHQVFKIFNQYPTLASQVECLQVLLVVHLHMGPDSATLQSQIREPEQDEEKADSSDSSPNEGKRL